MKRLIIPTLFFGLGVLLALNVGGLHSRLLTWSARNVVSVAVTSFIFENAPTAIYRFEQDMLSDFALGPHFLVVGGMAGFVVMSRKAMVGVLLPIGFAACFCTLIIRLGFKSFGLHWIDFLPAMIAAWCLAPIYLTGVGFGELLRRRRLPQWRLLDCLTAMTVACILCYAMVHRPFALIPTIVTVSFGLIAWRMIAGNFDAAPKRGEQPNPADVREGSAQDGPSAAARG